MTMTETILPKPGATNTGELIGTIVSTLRRYWDEAEGYQKLAYWASAILFTSGLFHTFVFLIDGGAWAGPVSWRKPIVFGLSFGITTLTIGWIMSFLPRRKVIGWLLMGIFSVAVLGEVFLITMQRWRGVPSHFNYSTPFDSSVFNTMGLLVNFVGLTIVIVTIWSFFALRGPTSMKWAIRIGLLLMVATQVLGNLIVANAIPQVIDFSNGEFVETGLETASIFRAAGVMKLPHAVTLHAAQVLPILAWLLQLVDWPEGRRTRVVVAAAVGYFGLIAVEIVQTFSGLAPFALSLLASLILVASIGLMLGAYITALAELRQSIAQT